MKTPPSLQDLDDADRDRLEAVLVDFDRAWHEGALDAAERRLPEGLRRAALTEMIKIDLERQRHRGKRPSLEDYLTRYPEVAAGGVVPRDLVEADLEIRGQFTPDNHQDADTVKVQPALADAADQPTWTGATLPPNTLQAGQRFGRYVIQRRLGKGGMGTVYLAHDTLLHRPVALKRPHLHGETQLVRERFLREARAAATLDHPNLCRIFDAGEIDGELFLAMAYVEGRPLSDLMREKPVSIEHAVTLVRQVALALEEAHQQGIVHRDLKPANILIDGRGNPVVVDFGLASRAWTGEERLTQTGSLLGTPSYMAPEQAAGNTALIGPATDVYSLGIILYELLTGRLPFRGSVGEVLAGVLKEAPPPPRTVRPDLDPRLEAVCLRALEKTPSRRFRNMVEFAAALAGAPRRASRMGRWSWAAAGAAAMIVVAAALWLANQAGRSDKSQDGRQTPENDKLSLPAKEEKPILHEEWVGKMIAKPLPKETISAIAFADKGRKPLIGGVHSRSHVYVRAWNPESSSFEKDKMPAHLGDLVSFSPDGRFALYSGGWMTSIVRSTLTGAEIRKVSSGPHVSSLGFAGHGRRLILGLETFKEGHVARVWEVESGTVAGQQTKHKKKIKVVALSADGHMALSASADLFLVWEVGTGRALIERSSELVLSAAFAPDGRHVVTGTGLGAVKIWSIADAACSRRWDTPTGAAVTVLALSAAGERLVSGSADGSLALWDFATGTLVADLKGHTEAITCAAVAPTGERILSACKGGTSGHGNGPKNDGNITQPRS